MSYYFKIFQSVKVPGFKRQWSGYTAVVTLAEIHLLVVSRLEVRGKGTNTTIHLVALSICDYSYKDH